MNIFICRPYYCYFPFSLGPRSCIGQVFAQVSRGLEQHLVSKHWASSGCGDHGWWWAPEATLMAFALTLFSSEGRSPPMPITGMSLKCYHKSRHPCSQGTCREGPACCPPSKLSWVSLLESKPLNGNHSQHSFASQSQAHRGCTGGLGDHPVAAIDRIKAGETSAGGGHKPELAQRR